MKPIIIEISSDTEASSAIDELNHKIPKSTKNSSEFNVLYPQVIACIEDFSAKARRLAKAGTTIHIQKEFTFPDATISIVLDYPKKNSYFGKLARFFKRD